MSARCCPRFAKGCCLSPFAPFAPFAQTRRRADARTVPALAGPAVLHRGGRCRQAAPAGAQPGHQRCQVHAARGRGDRYKRRRERHLLGTRCARRRPPSVTRLHADIISKRIKPCLNETKPALHGAARTRNRTRRPALVNEAMRGATTGIGDPTQKRGTPTRTSRTRQPGARRVATDRHPAPRPRRRLRASAPSRTSEQKRLVAWCLRTARPSAKPACARARRAGPHSTDRSGPREDARAGSPSQGSDASAMLGFYARMRPTSRSRMDTPQVSPEIALPRPANSASRAERDAPAPMHLAGLLPWLCVLLPLLAFASVGVNEPRRDAVNARRQRGPRDAGADRSLTVATFKAAMGSRVGVRRHALSTLPVSRDDSSRSNRRILIRTVRVTFGARFP